MIFNLFKRRKKSPPSVMRSEPFVCAFSEYPFLETKSKAQYPDYAFDKSDGLYWCVRVGEIEIPWSFVDDELGFGANGSFIVKRRNVNGASFDMKGIESTKVGDINYVFVNHVTSEGRQGFVKYFTPRLQPIIRRIAERIGRESFTSSVGDELLANKDFEALLDEHDMIPVSVSVSGIKFY